MCFSLWLRFGVTLNGSRKELFLVISTQVCTPFPGCTLDDCREGHVLVNYTQVVFTSCALDSRSKEHFLVTSTLCCAQDAHWLAAENTFSWRSSLRCYSLFAHSNREVLFFMTGTGVLFPIWTLDGSRDTLFLVNTKVFFPRNPEITAEKNYSWWCPPRCYSRHAYSMPIKNWLVTQLRC